MYGYPKRFRTRADVELAIGYLGSDWATPETKQRGLSDLQGLLDGRKHYVFDRILGEHEESDGSEPDYRVLTDDDTDDRRQYQLQDDPNAMLYRLGLTVADVQGHINQIQETME